MRMRACNTRRTPRPRSRQSMQPESTRPAPATPAPSPRATRPRPERSGAHPAVRAAPDQRPQPDVGEGCGHGSLEGRQPSRGGGDAVLRVQAAALALPRPPAGPPAARGLRQAGRRRAGARAAGRRGRARHRRKRRHDAGGGARQRRLARALGPKNGKIQPARGDVDGVLVSEARAGGAGHAGGLRQASQQRRSRQRAAPQAAAPAQGQLTWGLLRRPAAAPPTCPALVAARRPRAPPQVFPPPLTGRSGASSPPACREAAAGAAAGWHARPRRRCRVCRRRGASAGRGPARAGGKWASVRARRGAAMPALGLGGSPSFLRHSCRPPTFTALPTSAHLKSTVAARGVRL